MTHFAMIDEYTDEALREELRLRAERRAKGLCDYCGYPTTEKPCRFPERHNRVGPPTVKVRIAVCITDTRDWSAFGDDELPEPDITAIAHDGVDQGDNATIHWVTAEIPVPQSQQIEGLTEP